nr:Protein phosphatase 2C 71 [Ipomoea batatas]
MSFILRKWIHISGKARGCLSLALSKSNITASAKPNPFFPHSLNPARSASAGSGSCLIYRSATAATEVAVAGGLFGREAKMLETPTTDSTATANIATVKRYAPPNQRNRSLGRRKSGVDRLERANSYASDGEKNQNNIPRNITSLDHGDAGGSNRIYENRRPGGSAINVIPLNGCCNSDVFQLLNEQRPVMYTRNASNPSPWRLPHQMSQTASAGPSVGLQKDFLSELWQAMQNSNPSSK